MKVRVLFFGATADLVGGREVEIEFDGNVRAAEVFERIFAEYPKLAEGRDRKSLHLSVNQEYSDGDESIRDGDELAVFTAVSGG
jgi:molybdopterin converting factor small subunit